jgi:hypothetical protein
VLQTDRLVEIITHVEAIILVLAHVLACIQGERSLWSVPATDGWETGHLGGKCHSLSAHARMQRKVPPGCTQTTSDAGHIPAPSDQAWRCAAGPSSARGLRRRRDGRGMASDMEGAVPAGPGSSGARITAAEWIGRAIAARLHAVAAGRAASMRGWQKRAVRIALIAMAAIVYGETLNEGVRGTGTYFYPTPLRRCLSHRRGPALAQ